MASLRKKPTDDAVAPASDPLPVAPSSVAATSPAPAPELASPQDDATQALLHQLEAIKQGETMQQQAQIAALAAEERRRDWIQKNPLAQKFYNHLGAFHNEAIQAGAVDTSPQYFEHMESRLAALTQQPAAAATLANEMRERVMQNQPQPAPEPKQRTNIVSAPVSRDIPSGDGKRQSGKITLTREDQEFARIAGVTLEEYAKQKARYQQMRDSGEYRDQR